MKCLDFSVQEKKKMKHIRSLPTPADEIYYSEKGVDTAYRLVPESLWASEETQPEEGPAGEDGQRYLLKRGWPSSGDSRFQSAVRC